MTNCKIFSTQKVKWNLLHASKIPEPIKVFPEEVDQIVDAVGNHQNSMVFLSSDGKLYRANNSQTKKIIDAVEDLPPIKSIHSGFYHFFAVSDEETPKVYAWGDNNYRQFAAFNIAQNLTEPTLVMEDMNKFNVDQIYCSGHSTMFYNSKTKILYGCGQNNNGQLCNSINRSSISEITKSQENVERVFAGHSHHTFIIKTDGELYGFGYNTSGQLGDGKMTSTQFDPVKIELEFPTEDIYKIVPSFNATAILTNDGKVYVSGLNNNTGFETDLHKFKQYPQFKDEKKIIKEVSSGFKHFAYLSEDNEIWVGGSFSDIGHSSFTLRKIMVLEEKSIFNTLRCQDHDEILLLDLQLKNFLNQDLEKLLANESFSDCKIQKIPVLKLLIETRIGKKFDEIKKYLEENCSNEEIQNLLKWVYCDDISKRTNEILNHFGIQDPRKTKLLKNDIKKLLFDEETADFKLVIQNDEDDEDDDEEEEELPIHKFILAARSGLFLDMFQNLGPNLKTVKDYSGKSLETIELLIAFLYTDQLPITADTDQELVKEEFEDIIEYYQLNSKIPILNIFEKCSKK
ncbi:btk-binding protein-related [Anaeramoeba flamelloides]|uniref:Btk-binding protein-related n=1 Tax=Anaeramoeba flamelloides TaxID=1746091 RepID=A0AAV8A2D8_9EUKA|nr:btk-binding protein-related [Anaeramoeba flamelloides]